MERIKWSISAVTLNVDELDFLIKDRDCQIRLKNQIQMYNKKLSRK